MYTSGHLDKSTKKKFVYLLFFFFFLACKKEKIELQTGLYRGEYYTKHDDGTVVTNKDPQISITRLPGEAVRIGSSLIIPLTGNRIQGDIACCSVAFYSIYELVIDGTFYTKDNLSYIQGYFNAVGQAGPFSGTFKMIQFQ